MRSPRVKVSRRGVRRVLAVTTLALAGFWASQLAVGGAAGGGFLPSLPISLPTLPSTTLVDSIAITVSTPITTVTLTTPAVTTPAPTQATTTVATTTVPAATTTAPQAAAPAPQATTPVPQETPTPAPAAASPTRTPGDFRPPAAAPQLQSTTPSPREAGARGPAAVLSVVGTPKPAPARAAATSRRRGRPTTQPPASADPKTMVARDPGSASAPDPPPTATRTAADEDLPTVVGIASDVLEHASPGIVATIFAISLLGVLALSGGSVLTLVARFLRGSWDP